ncbi:glycosyltransferase [Pseudidiomarina salilacus]|uniref:glycosyltransferase n=1 Tax=Pseudidiomarina salilacus TaxID=3384452 RepID=UPI0039848321
MAVLFIHDHRFYSEKDSIEKYSGGGLNGRVLSYYSNMLGDLRVIGRKGGELKHDELSEYSLASTKNVSFQLLDDFKRGTSKFTKFTKCLSLISEEVKKSDAVIVRLPSEFGYIGAYYANKYNKELAIEVVGCPADSLLKHPMFWGRAYAYVSKIIMRYFVKKSSRSIYVTQSYLQSKYPSNGSMTACSDVEIDSVKRESNSSPDFDLEDVIELGLIGNYEVPHKGAATAIKAINILKHKYGYSNVRLRLLGGGDSTDLVSYSERNNVADNVFFDGVKSSGQGVFDWLDSLSIYVQPSYQEGLPRALIEAMSRRLPCVASNVGGIPELLDEKFLIEPGDSVALSDIIVELIRNRNLRNEASKQNVKVARRFLRSNLSKTRDQFWVEFDNAFNRKKAR